MLRPAINILAGAWAVLSSLWTAHPFNFFMVGLIVAFFGFWTYRKEWQGLANGIVGMWLILSAFVPELRDQSNLFISGLIVVGLATWRWVVVQKNPSAECLPGRC
jgi:hypothetical protein